MKKAIVTGASGFIGSHICKELLNRGYEVYGIGRNRDKLSKVSESPAFKKVSMDFESYSEMPEIIEERGFDFFIHAALFGVNGADKKDYRVQFKNTIVACDAVKTAKALGCRRFVLIGSVDEFEACFAPDAPFVMPSHARVYGLAKFVAENIGKTLALEADIEYVSAMLSLTYGEGNKTNILPNTIIRNSISETPMNLISGGNYFDMIYIDDAVSGILSVANKGKNMESYFIGHRDLKTFRSYVEEICYILGTGIELRFGSYKDSSAVVKFEEINREKAFLDIGYECRTELKDGILRTRDWLVNSVV